MERLMSTRAITLSFISLLLSIACASAQAALLNGSFETPPITSGTLQELVPDNWTWNGLGICYLDKRVEWADPVGTQMVLLIKDASGAHCRIWQNTGIQMAQGTTYQLSFKSQCYEETTREYAIFLNAADNSTSEGTDVASFGTFDSPNWTWFDHSVQYTCDSAHAGKYLSITLSSGWPGVATQGFAAIDNLTLTSFTPTPTPTPTPTLIPTSPIVGAVEFQDYDPVQPVAVAIKVDIKQEQTIVKSEIFVLNSGEEFSVADMAPGEYDVTIKACAWLRRTIHITKGASQYDMGTILLGSGDLHGDNECGSTSLSIILDKLGNMGDE